MIQEDKKMDGKEIKMPEDLHADNSNDNDVEKYKYHQAQAEAAKERGEEFPEKPENNTTTEDRLFTPDRGESDAGEQ